MTTPDFPLPRTQLGGPSESPRSPNRPAIGRVSLVGAGPGEPGAITLRALECLADADAVLYDYLVNPSLLRWATRPGVQLISLGGHGSRDQDRGAEAAEPRTPQRILSQSEICQKLVELAAQGLHVVRLKSGDPLIFARASEEIEALRAIGVDCEIVPGITSAFAAGSYAGIPLTNREHASAVALVTGHPAAEQPVGGAQPAGARARGSALDWSALAKFPGTLVVYMGTTQLEFWVGELLQHGKDRETPVAIVRRCGFSDQTVTRTTLGQLVAVAVTPKRIRPPVVFLVGAAIATPQVSSWFEDRPLRGQTVLVTRPLEDGRQVLRDLELLGAQAFHWPAIAVRPLDDFTELDQALQSLDQFRWITFQSPNGVRAFFARLWTIGLDVRAVGACRIAAVGQQTAKELTNYHLRANLVPSRFDADHLARELTQQTDSGPCLVVRATRGREVIAETLSLAGIRVTQVSAYQNVDTEVVPPEIEHAMQAEKIDWVTVTSNAIADNLVRKFGSRLAAARLASISPLTSQRLRDHGYDVAVEAEEATFAGVVKAILSAKSGS
jgi:uroporphyrinogen III methyltransferase/synthase